MRGRGAERDSFTAAMHASPVQAQVNKRERKLLDRQRTKRELEVGLREVKGLWVLAEGEVRRKAGVDVAACKKQTCSNASSSDVVCTYVSDCGVTA